MVPKHTLTQLPVFVSHTTSRIVCILQADSVVKIDSSGLYLLFNQQLQERSTNMVRQHLRLLSGLTNPRYSGEGILATGLT